MTSSDPHSPHLTPQPSPVKDGKETPPDPHHSHVHTHAHTHASGNLATAFFLNLFFAVIELIGGWFTNSVAILSDAIHDFGDSLSLAMAWYLEKVAKKKPDHRFSYGYRRFSLLGAVFISMVLLLSSVFVVKEAIGRLWEPQVSNAKGMLLLAILGIAINGLAVWRMKKGSSFNEKAVFLHLLEDVLGWVAVLLASLLMLVVDWPYIDPILSITITLWVLWNVWKNLRATFSVLLQGVPEGIDVQALQTALNALPAVCDVHDLHLWTLDGEQHILSFHAVIEDKYTSDDVTRIKKQARIVAHNFGIEHVTVEMETSFESDDCNYCGKMSRPE